MKFAFSAARFPDWDLQKIAAKAAEYGYDGVELGTLPGQSASTLNDVFLTDPSKVRGVFSAAGVKICCLSSSISFSREGRNRDGERLRAYIDTAAAIGCGWVKMFDAAGPAGKSKMQMAVEMGDWLLPQGSYAAGMGVGILVENVLSHAQDLWLLLDRISHPSIACSWNVFNAAQAGETSAVSVPVLNSKIQYAHVKDAKLGSAGAIECKLGEGDMQIAKFIRRLHGIGFAGDVTVDTDAEWLPDSIASLRKWDERLAISDAEAEAAKS